MEKRALDVCTKTSFKRNPQSISLRLSSEKWERKGGRKRVGFDEKNPQKEKGKKKVKKKRTKGVDPHVTPSQTFSHPLYCGLGVGRKEEKEEIVGLFSLFEGGGKTDVWGREA